jgi:glycosyltransferase involved in cell wall biosynthesis
MRILYISQYFPPEAGATQTRAYEMARAWIRAGHFVTMLTEFPNHPSGVIPLQYKGKLHEKATMDGIETIRVWVKASPLKNFRNRLLFYLTFMLNAIIAGILFCRGRYDFIYATSPPLFVGCAAVVLRVLKNVPLIFEVRDLWPESAVALGELKSSSGISISTWCEKLCYRSAFRIVVVTHGIYDKLVQRGISSQKLLLIPNGANVELFTFHEAARQSVRKELGLEDKFVAIYAGIYGVAQGLEVVLEAANLLKQSSDIHILMVGDGPKKAELFQLGAQLKLSNLTFLPEQPREKIPDYLSAADVALIPLRKIEIFKGALPSKIFDAWACERPVLINIDGESRELVERIKGGIYIPPEDSRLMAETIIKMKSIPGEIHDMGMNGRKFTIQNHSRQALAEKLIQQLEVALIEKAS